jgi:hypothetical protein
MHDVECPYCEAGLEINHDDGYGYEEDKTYMQECGKCGKTFSYTTSISFYHEAEKAPCQNGEPHSLKDIHRVPKEFAIGMKRCEWCDEEIMVDKNAHDKAIAEYRAKYQEARPAPKSAPKEAEEAQKHLTTAQGQNAQSSTSPVA